MDTAFYFHLDNPVENKTKKDLKHLFSNEFNFPVVLHVLYLTASINHRLYLFSTICSTFLFSHFKNEGSTHVKFISVPVLF